MRILLTDLFPLSFFWSGVVLGYVLSYLAHYNHTAIAMFMSFGFRQSLLAWNPCQQICLLEHYVYLILPKAKYRCILTLPIVD